MKDSNHNYLQVQITNEHYREILPKSSKPYIKVVVKDMPKLGRMLLLLNLQGVFGTFLFS